jgi:hypothetical protein
MGERSRPQAVPTRCDDELCHRRGACTTLSSSFESLGTGLSLTLVCNVGAAGLLTGEEEGWELEGTPYGDFHQLDPPVGITHLSVEGISVTA